MGGVPQPSLLDRMIARLATQRDLLARAAEMIRDIDGPILEIGLGKGRTYDHLRRLLPERRILAFDHELHAPADVTPPAEDLFLGEFQETLPTMAARIGRTAALAHADFGSPDRAHDARQAAVLGPLLAALVRPGGVVLSDRALGVEGWRVVPIESATAWPYHLWRVL